MEFVARILAQIPHGRRHLARYDGFYSNAARGKRKKAAAPAEPSCPSEAPEGAMPDGPHRTALRRRWAEMIRRVYEVDPLVCPRCGGEARVVGFITQPVVIKRILAHLRQREKVARPPPHAAQPGREPRVRSASPACRGAQRSRRCRFATDGNVLTRRSTFTFPHGTCSQAAVRPSKPLPASR